MRKFESDELRNSYVVSILDLWAGKSNPFKMNQITSTTFGGSAAALLK
jgi:hypothetical protein